MYETLSDGCPMPFGKYEGDAMEDVPARYLRWLWVNGMQYETGQGGVADYIYDNIDAMMNAHPDWDWGD